MNNKRVMAVSCTRLRETDKKNYYHNIAIAAVFDSVYGCLNFVAKTPQVGAKGARLLTYGI